MEGEHAGYYARQLSSPYGLVQRGEYTGWMTSGGNFLGFRDDGKNTYMLAEGSRAGIPWRFVDLDEAAPEAVEYETNCPNWKPWQTAHDHGMPRLNDVLAPRCDVANDHVGLPDHQQDAIAELYRQCSPSGDVDRFWRELPQLKAGAQ
jgi:hypothetical protein